ncbi:hypothetical protein TWF718_003392 [Orbilia javanica]|uniref:Uncharacterized protein n=1 Tax=Orbilia javanica TaxID=47235 RepID=A0AAN8MP83_9PEZI
MKVTITILAAFALAGISPAIASPTLAKEKRATCDCTNEKKRDLSAVAADPVVVPALPVIDTANTPDPSRDNCLKQLEQYGVYADIRCAGYGAPLDLINSYRGDKAAAVKKAAPAVN